VLTNMLLPYADQRVLPVAAAPACSVGSLVSAPRPLNRTAAGLLPGIGLGQLDVGEVDCDEERSLTSW
jgi:hypothetical protein